LAPWALLLSALLLVAVLLARAAGYSQAARFLGSLPLWRHLLLLEVLLLVVVSGLLLLLLLLLLVLGHPKTLLVLVQASQRRGLGPCLGVCCSALTSTSQTQSECLLYGGSLCSMGFLGCLGVKLAFSVHMGLSAAAAAVCCH
jgi:hypothetical protein